MNIFILFARLLNWLYGYEAINILFRISSSPNTIDILSAKVLQSIIMGKKANRIPSIAC